MAAEWSLSNANEHFWDQAVSLYDKEPWIKIMMRQLLFEIRGHRDWMKVEWATKANSKEVRVLDYACGPGMVSLALLPYVSRIRGIDSSKDAVDEYNRRAKGSGLTPQQVSAKQGNLLDKASATLDPALNTPEYSNFDLAIVALGFHHFDDPDLAAQRLVQRVKHGSGVLVIIDLLLEQQETQQEPGAKSEPVHSPKHGFSVTRTISILEKAGCTDIEVVVLGKPVHLEAGLAKQEGAVRLPFIARGRRAN